MCGDLPWLAKLETLAQARPHLRGRPNSCHDVVLRSAGVLWGVVRKQRVSVVWNTAYVLVHVIGVVFNSPSDFCSSLGAHSCSMAFVGELRAELDFHAATPSDLGRCVLRAQTGLEVRVPRYPDLGEAIRTEDPGAAHDSEYGAHSPSSSRRVQFERVVPQM